jgi:hypothetical protein
MPNFLKLSQQSNRLSALCFEAQFVSFALTECVANVFYLASTGVSVFHPDTSATRGAQTQTNHDESNVH